MTMTIRISHLLVAHKQRLKVREVTENENHLITVKHYELPNHWEKA